MATGTLTTCCCLQESCDPAMYEDVQVPDVVPSSLDSPGPHPGAGFSEAGVLGRRERYTQFSKEWAGLMPFVSCLCSVSYTV